VTWALVELLGVYSNRGTETDRLVGLLAITPTDTPPVTRPPKQVQRRLTDEQRAELIERYLSGERASELAAAFAVHRSTVSELLVKAGVRRPRSLTIEEVDKSVKLYQRGWSCARIGRHLDRDTGTVWLALKAAGVQLRDTHGRERRSD
jgi:hypothetical protein